MKSVEYGYCYGVRSAKRIRLWKEHNPNIRGSVREDQLLLVVEPHTTRDVVVVLTDGLWLTRRSMIAARTRFLY